MYPTASLLLLFFTSHLYYLRLNLHCKRLRLSTDLNTAICPPFKKQPQRFSNQPCNNGSTSPTCRQDAFLKYTNTVKKKHFPDQKLNQIASYFYLRLNLISLLFYEDAFFQCYFAMNDKLLRFAQACAGITARLLTSPGTTFGLKRSCPCTPLSIKQRTFFYL
jgi:hypothetical protein